MKFVNLTPYTIIDLANGATYPSAGVCRVPENDSEFDANGVCTVTYGEAEGLPPPQDGVLYIRMRFRTVMTLFTRIRHIRSASWMGGSCPSPDSFAEDKQMKEYLLLTLTVTAPFLVLMAILFVGGIINKNVRRAVRW